MHVRELTQAEIDAVSGGGVKPHGPPPAPPSTTANAGGGTSNGSANGGFSLVNASLLNGNSIGLISRGGDGNGAYASNGGTSYAGGGRNRF